MSTPHRALVVVDVQQEYFDGPLTIGFPPPSESLAQVVSAVRHASAHDVPVVVVQHDGGEGAPIFAPGTPAHDLHPELAAVVDPGWKQVRKEFSSVFVDTDLAAWLREQGVDTVTLVGYMTNNCVLASAADAERQGLAAEVLSDATGAIALGHDGGQASAREVHELLMTLLGSSWATVVTTARWQEAVAQGTALPPTSNLVEAAVRGREGS